MVGACAARAAPLRCPAPELPFPHGPPAAAPNAPALRLQAAAKIMGKKKKGRIISLASVVGQIGNAGQVQCAHVVGRLHSIPLLLPTCLPACCRTTRLGMRQHAVCPLSCAHLTEASHCSHSASLGRPTTLPPREVSRRSGFQPACPACTACRPLCGPWLRRCVVLPA